MYGPVDEQYIESTYIVLRRILIDNLPIFTKYYNPDCKKETYRGSIEIDTEIGTYKVRTNTDTLKCFRKSLKCCDCDKVGNLFLLVFQRSTFETSNDDPFLLVFHYENGIYTLMTRDHIRPRAYGGRNNVENVRTMCIKCNTAKGSKWNGLDKALVSAYKKNQVHVKEPTLPRSQELSLSDKIAIRKDPYAYTAKLLRKAWTTT